MIAVNDPTMHSGIRNALSRASNNETVSNPTENVMPACGIQLGPVVFGKCSALCHAGKFHAKSVSAPSETNVPANAVHFADLVGPIATAKAATIGKRMLVQIKSMSVEPPQPNPT